MIRSICSAFVNTPLFRKRNADAKLLWYTLYMHPAQHMCGIFVLDDEHMSLDSSMPLERVRAALAELDRFNLCRLDRAKDLVWLPEMTTQAAKIIQPKWTGVKAVDKYMASLGESALCYRVCHTLSIPYRYPTDTLLLDSGSDSGAGSGSGTDPESKPIAGEPSLPLAVQTSLLPGEPLVVRQTRAKKPRVPKAESKTGDTWTAYAESYARRYGEPPLRNAKINGQLAQLVAQMGADAPGIAAHYLASASAYYVTSGHSVGLLLRDCQKLRTEMQTGQRINAETARRNENTEANPFAQELLSRMKARKEAEQNGK